MQQGNTKYSFTLVATVWLLWGLSCKIWALACHRSSVKKKTAAGRSVLVLTQRNTVWLQALPGTGDPGAACQLNVRVFRLFKRCLCSVCKHYTWLKLGMPWYSTYWSTRNTGSEESWLSAEVKNLYFCWPCRVRPYVGNALQLILYQLQYWGHRRLQECFCLTGLLEFYEVTQDSWTWKIHMSFNKTILKS